MTYRSPFVREARWILAALCLAALCSVALPQRCRRRAAGAGIGGRTAADCRDRQGDDAAQSPCSRLAERVAGPAS